MKNAAEGLNTSQHLSVSYVIQSNPIFGYVSEIALVDSDSPDGRRQLFFLGEQAANEIQERDAQNRSRKEAMEYLDYIPADLIRSLSRVQERRETEGERRSVSNYLFDILASGGRYTSRISPEMRQEIDNVTAGLTSPEDLKRAFESLRTRLDEEIVRLRAEPIRNKVITFAGEADRIPNYVMDLLAKLANSRVLYLKERRQQIGPEEARRLLSLKVTRGGPEVHRNIKQTEPPLLGVKIDAFQSEAPSRRSSARMQGEQGAEIDIDDFLADVNGSGIREALRIVLDVEFEHPKVLLIEEPEIYLHPSLETSMMRYLRRVADHCQVFISTHSTNFLDSGEMRNAYLISKEKSTKVQHLSLNEAETYIPQELGMRLSSLFMFDRLVFVEGPSDEAVIREWASTLKVNLSQWNVGFVHMGGVRNFAYYAAKATVEFLSKRRVKMWFVIDRDERNTDEISRLQELIGDKATLKVLERRELENYLVCPRVLVKFILSKRGPISPSDVLPSEADIQKALEEVAENLKPRVIAKMLVKEVCLPVFPRRNELFDDITDRSSITTRIVNEMKSMIEQVTVDEAVIQKKCDEIQTALDPRWPAKKLELVPGDLLVDSVCKVFGVRFRKDTDSARIAALMTENEIPSEIRALVREMGS